MWKGGRYLNTAGYVMLYMPTYPRAGSNGYVREHIKVWEDTHGTLQENMTVHHLNGIRTDNRPENLSVLPRHNHKSFHLVHLLYQRIRELEKELNKPSAFR